MDPAPPPIRPPTPAGTHFRRIIGVSSLILLGAMSVWSWQDAAPSPYRPLGFLASLILLLWAWSLEILARRAASTATDPSSPPADVCLKVVKVTWVLCAVGVGGLLFLANARPGERTPSKAVQYNLVILADEFSRAMEQLAQPPGSREPGLPPTAYPAGDEGRVALVRDAAAAVMTRLRGTRNPYDGTPAFEVGAAGSHLGKVYLVPTPVVTSGHPEAVVTLTALIQNPDGSRTQTTKLVSLPTGSAPSNPRP